MILGKIASHAVCATRDGWTSSFPVSRWCASGQSSGRLARADLALCGASFVEPQLSSLAILAHAGRQASLEDRNKRHEDGVGADRVHGGQYPVLPPATSPSWLARCRRLKCTVLLGRTFCASSHNNCRWTDAQGQPCLRAVSPPCLQTVIPANEWPQGRFRPGHRLHVYATVISFLLGGCTLTGSVNEFDTLIRQDSACTDILHIVAYAACPALMFHTYLIGPFKPPVRNCFTIGSSLDSNSSVDPSQTTLPS